MNRDELLKWLLVLLVGGCAWFIKDLHSCQKETQKQVAANAVALAEVKSTIDLLERSLIQSHRGGTPLLKDLPLVGGAFKSRLDIEKKDDQPRASGSWDNYE